MYTPELVDWLLFNFIRSYFQLFVTKQFPINLSTDSCASVSDLRFVLVHKKRPFSVSKTVGNIAEKRYRLLGTSTESTSNDLRQVRSLELIWCGSGSNPYRRDALCLNTNALNSRPPPLLKPKYFLTILEKTKFHVFRWQRIMNTESM